MSFQWEPRAFSLFIYSTLTGRQAILHICTTMPWWREWQCTGPIAATPSFRCDLGQVGCCELFMTAPLVLSKPWLTFLSLALSLFCLCSQSLFTLVVIFVRSLALSRPPQRPRLSFCIPSQPKWLKLRQWRMPSCTMPDKRLVSRKSAAGAE